MEANGVHGGGGQGRDPPVERGGHHDGAIGRVTGQQGRERARSHGRHQGKQSPDDRDDREGRTPESGVGTSAWLEIGDSLIGAQHGNQAGDGREHRGEVEEAKLGGREETSKDRQGEECHALVGEATQGVGQRTTAEGDQAEWLRWGYCGDLLHSERVPGGGVDQRGTTATAISR